VAKPVAKPAEEELPSKRAAEHDVVHGCGGVGRQHAVVGPGEVGVVDAAEQLDDDQHLQLLAHHGTAQRLDAPLLLLLPLPSELLACERSQTEVRGP